MKRFLPTFETHLLAFIALLLYLRQGWRLFHDAASVSAAGCRNTGSSLHCAVLHEYAPTGTAFMLTALLTAIGIYACFRTFRGRRGGLVILAVFFALQIPVFAAQGKLYFVPGGFTLYYLHRFADLTAGINLPALILCFNAIGRLRNLRYR